MSEMTRPKHDPSSRRRRAAAFTLVEMITSLVIMSILLVAMGGTLMLSSQAVPDVDNRMTRITEAAGILDQIASELTYAITVTEMTETAVTFTVADRDSDSTPETIRYAWSGFAGDPLTRRYSSGATVELLADVHAFSLTYSQHELTESSRMEISEGAESELIRHDVAAASTDFPVTETDAIGQYFLPTLPADATAWSITRILFMARQNGKAQGETYVQLCLPDASRLPTGTVLEEFVMNEGDLATDYEWEEFSVSGASGLAPETGICLTLSFKKKSPTADIQYDSGSGTGLVTSSDGGSAWSGVAGQSMMLYVYGTVKTATTIGGETKEYVDAVTISLQVGTDSTMGVRTAARILNEAEVTP